MRSSRAWSKLVYVASLWEGATMVLTKAELINSLKNEVRILLHLAGKVDGSKLDYRPTPKQRSTLELMKYLSMMGPELVEAAKAGAFDEAAWTKASDNASARTFDEALSVIAAQSDLYPKLLADASDEDLRTEVEIFGEKSSRGAFLVDVVLASCVAYRMQLFLYLKACGREELTSSNLWSGVDGPAAG